MWISKDIITIILLILSLIVWYTIASGGNYIILEIKQLFAAVDRKSSFTEISSLSTRNNFLLSVNYIFSFAIFWTTVVSTYYSNTKPYIALIFIGAILVYHFSKYLVLVVLNFIFGDKSSTEKMKIWGKNYVFLNLLSGILYLFLTFLVVYSKPIYVNFAISLGFISIVIYLLSAIYRMVNIFFINLTTLFYLILYFCTLEILPLIVVAKWVSIN